MNSMKNTGTMYRYEVRKILCRKITFIVLSLVTLIMIAINAGEYIIGGKTVNSEEIKIAGRTVDDSLLSEMREAIDPKNATLEDGESVSIGIGVKDRTYEPLINYLFMLGGNYDKAYNMSEEGLYKIFDDMIDTNINEQFLTEKEKTYWEKRREGNPDKLTYGKIQNAYGDSLTIMYVTSLLALIAIAATLSGVFSDETGLKTDALIFSSVNGKKRLMVAKFFAGITVGVFETAVLLLACVGTEFAILGMSGGEASVQFFVGPTVMDMKVGRALIWAVCIMLIIGMLYSVIAMCLSQVTHNSIAVVAVLMFMWLMSMVNLPYSLGIVKRIWDFLPVTFLGSWTFTDYHLVWFFGRHLTVIEAAPVIYIMIAAVLTVITKISYNRYQVKGR